MKTASGFAALNDDGEVEMSTVSPTEISAMVNGLACLRNVIVGAGISDKTVRMAAEEFGLTIIPVTVTAVIN